MYRLCDGIEFMKSLPDQSVDGMFTDPPWGVQAKKMRGTENWLDLIWLATDECARIFKPGARALIWVGMIQLADVIRSVRALDYRWTVFCYYCPPRYIAHFESQLDPILLFQLPGDPLPKSKLKLRQIYQKYSKGRRDTMHPCARPFTTVKHILRDWFDEGEYVIDPFAGSDTTGVACERLNLRYDTCEVDPMMYRYGLDRHKTKTLPW